MTHVFLRHNQVGLDRGEDTASSFAATLAAALPAGRAHADERRQQQATIYGSWPFLFLLVFLAWTVLKNSGIAGVEEKDSNTLRILWMRLKS